MISAHFFIFFEEIMIEKLKEISKNMKNKWMRSSRKQRVLGVSPNKQKGVHTPCLLNFGSHNGEYQKILWKTHHYY